VFKSFLESIKNQNPLLIESFQKAYKTLFESILVNWKFPEWEDEVGEFERYHIDLQLLKNLFDEDKTLITLTDDIWRKLGNTESYKIKSLEQARTLAKKYGKDIDNILEAIDRGIPLPAPIVLKLKNKYDLVAGNTRLMVCKALGITPEVLFMEMPEHLLESEYGDNIFLRIDKITNEKEKILGKDELRLRLMGQVKDFYKALWDLNSGKEIDTDYSIYKKLLESYLLEAEDRKEDAKWWENYMKNLTFSTPEEAKETLTRLITRANETNKGLFPEAKYENIAGILELIKRGNKLQFKSKFKESPVKIEYKYNTNRDLIRKQKSTYTDYYGQEFGKSFKFHENYPIEEIHGTETTDPDAVNEIVNAIKEGEELPPILIEDGGGILDGHHRFEAAKKLGLKTVPVIVYSEN
jgi:hypothetical protein